MFEKVYMGAVSILALGTGLLIVGVFLRYIIQWQELFLFFEYLFGSNNG